jgi:iron complex transport system substrate-binding protein
MRLQRSTQRHFYAAAVALVALLTIAANSFASPGTPPRPPQRLITLLPSLTETVCALEACDRLVGVDRYSDWPNSVKDLQRVGGMDDAVVERIVALKPDAVLAATSTRAVERLRGLGLKVTTFDSDTHEQVRDSMVRIAQLLGTPERGAALWQRTQADIDQAAASVPAAWRGAAVYFEADASPYAAGEASFVGQTLARLGLRNIAPAALGAFPRLNPEAVVRAQPAVVMVQERNAKELAQRPGWKSLKALQAGKVCAFPAKDYELLIRPGPRMGQAAQLMAQCLKSLGQPAP